MTLVAMVDYFAWPDALASVPASGSAVADPAAPAVVLTAGRRSDRLDHRRSELATDDVAMSTTSPN